MSTRPRGTARVVVAFDPYLPGRAALQLALRLGSPGTSSLHAVYVEETDPLTLGAFPWAREVRTATAEAQPLRFETIERIYRRRAAEARALFDAVATGISEARFEQVRGSMVEQLRRIAADAAGVLLDWPSAGRSSRQQAATVVRALLDLPAPLLGLVRPPGAATTSVMIVCAGNAAGPARELAERFVASARARITVLRDPVSATSIIERARAERADTLLLQRGGAMDNAHLLADLALAWAGSLLLLR